MVTFAADNNIDIASLIDHSLLSPTATPEQVERCCEEADRFRFATVCISPCYVRLAVSYLHGKRPQVGTVIGFPSGASTSQVKRYEAEMAAEDGATELDVVINLGWLKAGLVEDVHRDLAEICDSTGLTVKAILETAVLTEAEIRLAAEICMDAGAAFLKTSTGWQGGATVADVRLLKSIAQDRIGVKASGGIKTLEQAVELVAAGATRLGTSRGPELLRAAEQGEQ